MLYRSEGIILRTQDFGEADKITTIFTKSKGKISAVANGARRVRNRLLGPTQIFTYARFILLSGKNLDTISQAEIVNSNQEMRDDLEKMAYGMYVSELVDVFNEEGVASTEIFYLILDTFALGNRGLFPLATRAFELRLMKFLGYQPRLENCLGCGIIPSERIWFSREGGVLCANCKQQFTPVIELSLGAWELMKRLLTSDFSRLSILRPSQQLLDEIEIAMRAYLDFRMERPLKSLPFLMSLCSPNGLTRRIEVNE